MTSTDDLPSPTRPSKSAKKAREPKPAKERTTADRFDRTDNSVFLRGRLGDVPVERDLPSGDVLATFRLTVERPPGERAKVDSLECVAVAALPRRVLARCRAGDVLEVQGSLQRRFWRSPVGPASRYAVAVTAIRRLPATPARSSGVAVGPSISARPRDDA